MAIRDLKVGNAPIPTMPNLILEGDPPTLTKASIDGLRTMLTQIQAIFSGGISLGDGTPNARLGHISAQYIPNITSPGANVEFTVPHGLKRLAIGIIPTYASKGGMLYFTGRGSLGRQNVRLKSTTAATIYDIIVF